MVRSTFRVLGPALAAILSGAAAVADVLVVDDGGGADFTTIQAAINAATNGDTILVRPGAYPTFEVIDKALDIVADGPEFPVPVVVSRGPRIRNLSAGKRVLVQNMRFIGQFFFGSSTAPHGFSLLDNEGAVRFERCDFFGLDNLFMPSNCKGLGAGAGWTAVVVTRSADVAFLDCEISGGSGLVQGPKTYPGEGCGSKFDGGDGGHGVHAVDSRLALYGCSVTGGDGGAGYKGKDGGRGVWALGSSFALVTRSSLQGGTGAESYGWAYGQGGGAGGAGILGPTSTALLIDAALVGGEGGWPFGIDAPPAMLLDALEESGFARGISVPSPVRVAEPFTLRFSGEQGETVFLLLSGLDTFLPLPELHGVLLCDPAIVLGPWSLDEFGSLSLPLLLGPLTGAPAALTAVLQSVHLTVALDVVVGNGRHMLVLDPAY